MSSDSDTIQISYRDGVRKILINRPKKRNAISPQMYQRLTDIIKEDAQNDEIVVTIITGVGHYYSSGNDLKASVTGTGGLHLAKNLIQAFIDYPKLIIAVVNGPAIGVAATTAVLCDIVYASDKAHFNTPFLPLGLCAEGGSSYTFPQILGRSKASELLYLNKKLSAAEALKCGLISEVIPHEQLESFIQSLYKYGSLPVNTLKLNKKLVMHHLRDVLTESNNREFEGLDTCVQSEEFGQIMMEFMNRKSKL